MVIRRFEEADAPAVSEMILHTLQISNAKDYPPDILEEVMSRQKPEDITDRARQAHLYVAEDPGGIAGCGAVGPYEGKKEESFLSSVFVRPERQGEGIGRRILETLEKDEYFLRARKVRLHASVTALGFYRKLGYDFAGNNTEPDADLLYHLEKPVR